jgi:hypothetical protein
MGQQIDVIHVVGHSLLMRITDVFVQVAIIWIRVRRSAYRRGYRFG